MLLQQGIKGISRSIDEKLQGTEDMEGRHSTEGRHSMEERHSMEKILFYQTCKTVCGL